MKYRIGFYMDNEYEVMSNDGEYLFKGTLCECEAWIRLTEDDNIDF